jgi:hypothetical protein
MAMRWRIFLQYFVICHRVLRWKVWQTVLADRSMQKWPVAPEKSMQAAIKDAANKKPASVDH